MNLMFRGIMKKYKSDPDGNTWLLMAIFLVLYALSSGLWHFWDHTTGFYTTTEGLNRVFIKLDQELLSGILIIFFRMNHAVQGTILLFPNGSGLEIQWPCSGVRQLLQVLFITLLLPGPFISKLWFVPLSLGIVFLATILHLVILALVAGLEPSWFYTFHAWITRIVFYIFFFLIAVIWIEGIAGRAYVKRID